MKTKLRRKLAKIQREIGNTEIDHDGRYQQLIKEKEQLELSFYREVK